MGMIACSSKRDELKPVSIAGRYLNTHTVHLRTMLTTPFPYSNTVNTELRPSFAAPPSYSQP